MAKERDDHLDRFVESSYREPLYAEGLEVHNSEQEQEEVVARRSNKDREEEDKVEVVEPKHHSGKA